MAKRKLTIEFGSDAAAKHFAEWLCGSGEQQYWEWMEYREEEEAGNITAVDFDYFPPAPGKKFIGDWTIRTTAGRLTKRDNG